MYATVSDTYHLTYRLIRAGYRTEGGLLDELRVLYWPPGEAQLTIQSPRGMQHLYCRALTRLSNGYECFCIQFPKYHINAEYALGKCCIYVIQ